MLTSRAALSPLATPETGLDAVLHPVIQGPHRTADHDLVGHHIMHDASLDEGHRNEALLDGSMLRATTVWQRIQELPAATVDPEDDGAGRRDALPAMMKSNVSKRASSSRPNGDASLFEPGPIVDGINRLDRYPEQSVLDDPPPPTLSPRPLEHEHDLARKVRAPKDGAAAPRSIAMWPSWPHACIMPSCLDA